MPLQVWRNLVGRNDAVDLPISHQHRPWPNSIRCHDAPRKESLPVHARAYRDFPAFSTFPPRRSSQQELPLADLVSLVVMPLRSQHEQSMRKTLRTSRLRLYLVRKPAAAKESILTDWRAPARVAEFGKRLTITQ